MAKAFNYRSRILKPITKASPRGNGEKPIFEVRVVEGVKKLVVTGKENWKDFIEASKNETLISNIIKRFEQGDVSVLNKKVGFYGDVTGMPSNLAEAQQLLINLEDKFNNLPLEQRKVFDNSFDKYVQAVSSMTVDEFSNVFSSESSSSAATVTDNSDNNGGSSDE